jgi:hypothetical protein
MSEKPTSKKAKTAKPKAPQVIYIEICPQGNTQFVDENPRVINDCMDEGSRIARYTFSSFVEVKTETVVTDIAA